MKGIKREFSVARTPQQNGVTERKNKTLFEAARTMLADSLLPIPFWAEAVNTVCYVQNRVLVTKPHNKTPYELLLGRTPSIGFMRPFGCLVTILNTLDPLGKFDRKADEGFFIGYSVNSKAFRVFNSRTRIVQKILHINFLENQPNVAGSGPKWLFDIDTLTQSMNYQPVVAGNQPNHNACIKENLDSDDVAFDVKENENDVHVSPSNSAKPKKHDDKDKRDGRGKSPIDLSTGVRDLRDKFEEFLVNNTNIVNAASTHVTAVGPNPTNSTNSFNTANPSDTVVSLNFGIARKSLYVDPFNYPDDLDMPALEDIVYSDDEEDVGAEADFSNLETNSQNKARLVAQGHTQEKGIDYDEVFALVVRIEAIRLFLAYASFMGFMVYQMDVKCAFLYGTIEEEVYVCQPLGFEDPNYHNKVYKVLTALYGLHQAPRAWYETLANYLLESGFQRRKIDQTLFIKKQKGDIFLVQMSSMGELTFFLGLQVKQKVDGIFIRQDKYVAEILRKFGFTYVKSASTHIETKKPLLKDPDGKDLDVHIYRHFITAVSYKLMLFGLTKDVAVKLMLLGQKHFLTAVSYKLMLFGLTKNAAFKLMLLGHKSDASAGFDQIVDFLNAQVIQYALMVNPTIYVSCIKQFWATVSIKKANDFVKLQALIDGKKVVITEDVIQQALPLDDADGVECLPNEEIFAELARMGYEKPPPKLTFYKAFFSAKWKFLIHTLVLCVSAKRTAWNEFCCSMTFVVICLATEEEDNVEVPADPTSPSPTNSPSPPPQDPIPTPPQA
nr:copia protein [Tanacetum cinerariifolium]